MSESNALHKFNKFNEILLSHLQLIKQLYTFNAFVDIYNVNIIVVECCGIISALLNNWNEISMGETIKLHSKIVVNVKAENKTCRYLFYKEWENELGASVEGWHGIYIDTT